MLMISLVITFESIFISHCEFLPAVKSMKLDWLWALSQLPGAGQGLSKGDQTLVRAAGPWGKKRGAGRGSGPRSHAQKSRHIGQRPWGN